MCRLAAYIGPQISLERFLLKPPHGLVEQSFAPRELKEARMNADGYGFGWFGPDRTPARFVSVLPIWSDTNLPALSPSLFSGAWAANVRSATPGFGTHPANTQPFADDEFLFLHNGFVTDFARILRPRLRELLVPEIESKVHGNTDSEYLFALLRHYLAEDLDLPVEEGLLQVFALLNDCIGEVPAFLNFVLTDGERIYAARHALNAECPSLYFTTDDEDYPEGMLVASEPLTESRYWQPVPERHVLILGPDQPPELLPL